MRLLKVETLLDSGWLELVDFTAAQFPSYATLSHTWSQDEVLYSDLTSGTAFTKAAIHKIHFTASQARSHGLEYVWIDTCCIDKSSSAELQEAINSMYTWYQRADVCYVFLDDVSTHARLDHHVFRRQFVVSRWFSRGWTLQELLAPQKVQFFAASGDHVWLPATTSIHDDRQVLVDMIASASGIDQEVIAGGPSVITKESIATRMEWAADRMTTREEDMAYSLLGIFDVNMPLLYGEGRKAFRRLQQAILDQSDDSSIFCWTTGVYEDAAGHIRLSGLLADEPSRFGSITGAIRVGSAQDRAHTLPYSMTNKGLQISLPLLQITQDIYLGLLDCRLLLRCGVHERCAIHVIRLLSGTNQFARLLPHMVVSAPMRLFETDSKVETIFVHQGLGPRTYSLTEENLPNFYQQYGRLMQTIDNDSP